MKTQREVLQLPPSPSRLTVYASLEVTVTGVAVRCLKCGSALFQRMRIEQHDALELLEAIAAHRCFRRTP